jgi:hypothetical protein
MPGAIGARTSVAGRSATSPSDDVMQGQAQASCAARRPGAGAPQWSAASVAGAAAHRQGAPARRPASTVSTARRAYQRVTGTG